MKALLDDVVAIAKRAGQKILEIYQNDDFEVQIKSDNSPLTKADLAAHNIILDFLQTRYPAIPCLSEESTSIEFDDRKHWSQCFVIDPLDGTKEFIARNGEFTVNIALQKNGRPILGVIYVPVTDVVYFAAEGIGAFKQKQHKPEKAIKVRSLIQKGEENHITVVASRRNGLDEVAALCKNFNNYELKNVGSSLKMCLVAEGKADLYPRFGPTSEWDTAAAQAIVEQAGGKIVQMDFADITYNQKESLLNSSFWRARIASFVNMSAFRLSTSFVLSAKSVCIF
jgi:3'(2'), 5'-bisphosphate nucleotidase